MLKLKPTKNSHKNLATIDFPLKLLKGKTITVHTINKPRYKIISYELQNYKFQLNQIKGISKNNKNT